MFRNVLLAVLVPLAAGARETNTPPVILDYFYGTACPGCRHIQSHILPEFKERYEGLYVLNRYDTDVRTNAIRLMVYQKKLGIVTNEPVCIVVDYRYVLNGTVAVQLDLAKQVDKCLAARQEPGWKLPDPIRVDPDERYILEDRLRSFTPSAVAVAGLIDGINPCAISTLVFFMSLLAVARVRGWGLLAMGLSFCLASFVTYLAIGFGLLRVLYVFEGFPVVRAVVDVLMIVVLLFLGFLSFRDAFRYRKSGDPDDVTLQLPDTLKGKIHDIIRAEVRRRRGLLLIGGFVVGALVTGIESICTGQVYVPTLVLVIKSGKCASTAWPYLLLYNVMFIVPRVAVFVVTWFGLRTEALLGWSKRNVVPSKVLLGLFFVAMAVLLVVLR